MQIRHYVLTLTGSAQQLLASVTGIPNLARQVILQAASGNAGIIKVGSYADGVTTDSYGFAIPIPVTSIPAAPIILNGPVQVDSIAVFGTNNDKLRVTVIT